MSPNIIPVTGAPGFEPEHPGTILRDEFLVPHRLEVSAAADRLGVTRQTVHRILAGTSAVTADMALRLGKLTGTTPAFWLNLQATHDLWHQGRRMAAELSAIDTMTAVAKYRPVHAAHVVAAGPRGGAEKKVAAGSKTHRSTARPKVRRAGNRASTKRTRRR